MLSCSFVNRMSLTTSELKHKVDGLKIRFEEEEHISIFGCSSFYFGKIIPRTWILFFFFFFNIRHLSKKIIPHKYPKTLRFWRLFSHQSCIYNSIHHDLKLYSLLARDIPLDYFIHIN